MTEPAFHKIALVTGAGRGLGSVIAKSLASEGYRVAISDIEESNAQEVATAITDAGGTSMAIELDVRNLSAFESGLETIQQEWGGVGVLVNNAAMTKTTPIFDITPDEFTDITTVNLRGTFLGCQIFGRYFSEQKYGRIINLASLAGQNGGSATGAHYAASKGGIISLTKVFARDLASHGVTVNAVAPGPLDLEMVRELLPPQKLAEVIKTIPVGTLGDPVFIGEIVKLMASPSAASMTGTTVDANGGLYVR